MRDQGDGPAYQCEQPGCVCVVCNAVAHYAAVEPFGKVKELPVQMGVVIDALAHCCLVGYTI